MPQALARCVVFLSLFAVLSKGADLAAPTEYEGRPISEVRYEPRSQPVATPDLARLVTFKSGTPLHAEEVRDAIKRLYATGEYSNIEVEAVPDGNSVALVIRTTEQWFVGPVEVHGKVKMPPSEGQLQNAARLELGTPFDDPDLDTATEGIRNLLQRNGLYLAKIEPKIERDAEHQQVSMTFRVDSGKRARFTTPVIIGDTRVDPEKVMKWAKYHGWFRWKQATQDNTQRGLRNIRGKYNKQDRLTADVTLDHEDYLPDENRVRATIAANGGPKIKIATDGAKVSKGNLEKYVPVFDEETVNRDLLVRGVRNLRDYFQNKGYFDVEVDYSSTDVSKDERNITYVITPGERHKVVSVEVHGEHYFNEDQIRERMFTHTAGFLVLRHGRYSEGFSRRDEAAIKALYQDNGFRDVKVSLNAIDDYKG